MAIYPTPEQIQELLRGPAEQPVVMVNLLRFKRRADTSPDDTRSGQEAYMTYARRMREIVESQGGRFLWSGHVDSVVIGDAEATFQIVGLVEYPSRQKSSRSQRASGCGRSAAIAPPASRASGCSRRPGSRSLTAAPMAFHVAERIPYGEHTSVLDGEQEAPVASDEVFRGPPRRGR